MKSKSIIVKGNASSLNFFFFFGLKFQLHMLVYFSNCGLLLVFKYHEISVSHEDK